MLKRYLKINAFISQLKSKELVNSVLILPELREVENLSSRLSELDTVTRELQRESTTISDVQVIFDAVIDTFTETCERLSVNASVVRDNDLRMLL